MYFLMKTDQNWYILTTVNIILGIFSQKTFTVKQVIIIIKKEVLLLERKNKQVFSGRTWDTKTASTLW